MSAFANIRRPTTFAVAIAATFGLAACGGGRERPRADVCEVQVRVCVDQPRQYQVVIKFDRCRVPCVDVTCDAINRSHGDDPPFTHHHRARVGANPGCILDCTSA